MAYVSSKFNLVGEFPLEADTREWWYVTTDDISVLTQPNYVTDAGKKGVLLGDLVMIYNKTAPTLFIGQITALAGSGYNATATISVAAGTGGPQTANFRNLLDGGDFTVNPWQRGTSFSGIAATLTYTADRWFAVGGAAASISVSRQVQTDVAGFNNSLRFGRANTDTTTTIKLGQAMESADSYRCQGQPVTLSFWAKAGAQFSAAGSKLTVQVFTATSGTDQSAVNLAAGTWTGLVSVINSTVALTTTAQRFQLTGVVPANATQLGILLSYLPTGTSNATDFVDLYGAQLEIGSVASPFEHRDIQVELEICQRYFWQINEPASGVIVAVGMVSGASTELFYLATPVQMRVAPTVTVTTGAFKVNLAGTATTATITSNATHTPNQIGLTGNAAGTVGQGTLLQGGGGAGLITAFADY
jgi:hypothetical protein